MPAKDQSGQQYNQRRPVDSVVDLRPQTVVVAAGRTRDEGGQPLNVPLVLASNFRATPARVLLAAGGPAREYARDDGTPGWEALEAVLGQLENGQAVAFASGMAAAAAVLDLLPAGARVVAPADCYHGVRALLADGEQLGRWHVELVGVTDLPALCAAGRAAGALVAVDNTFATPLLQRPLALGAHLAVHSATKFIGGHSDLLLGLAVAGDPEVAQRLRRRREVAGAVPGGLEAFLALRGMRTMAVRLEQGQRSAGELAR